MQFRNLSDISIELLTRVFNTAFAVYYVPISFTEKGMLFRIRRGRIDLRLSVGAFEQGELVAFMLSGTDDWHGQSTIYNAGTGVIPDFRGKKLVDQMYNWAMPLWRKEGYTQATLEVIVENERAIRAYERVGMRIDRKLISLKSPRFSYASITTLEAYSLEEVEKPNWPLYSSLRLFDASWDFCQAGVEAVVDTCRFFELKNNDQLPLAYAIVNDKAQIAQAGVSPGLDGVWGILMNKLSKDYTQLSWINIDERADALIQQLRQGEWKGVIDQYEMKMKI